MPRGRFSFSKRVSMSPRNGFHLPTESLDEGDTPAEVDAVFRVQRRIAVGYFLLFLLVTFAVPTLTLLLDWWSAGRLLGGMTPSFAMVAFGLYVFFFALAVAASTLASAVEERMLGGPGWRDHELPTQGGAPSAAQQAQRPPPTAPETAAGDDGSPR